MKITVAIKTLKNCEPLFKTFTEEINLREHLTIQREERNGEVTVNLFKKLISKKVSEENLSYISPPLK